MKKIVKDIGSPRVWICCRKQEECNKDACSPISWWYANQILWSRPSMLILHNWQSLHWIAPFVMTFFLRSKTYYSMQKGDIGLTETSWAICIYFWGLYSRPSRLPLCLPSEYKGVSGEEWISLKSSSSRMASLSWDSISKFFVEASIPLFSCVESFKSSLQPNALLKQTSSSFWNPKKYRIFQSSEPVLLLLLFLVLISCAQLWPRLLWRISRW